MIRIAIAAAVLAAAGPSSTGEPAAAPAKTATRPSGKGQASPGKPRAPVHVQGRLVQGSVHLELTFDAPARDVTVTLHGTNGLTVADPSPRLPKADFAGGEKLPLDVTFTAPGGQANVVVSIEGEFGGVRQGTVASFRVGKLSPEQQQKQQRGVATDAKGGKVRLGPAEER